MIQPALIPQPDTFQCLGQSSAVALREVQAVPLVLGPVAQVCSAAEVVRGSYFKRFHKHWRCGSGGRFATEKTDVFLSCL